MKFILTKENEGQTLQILSASYHAITHVCIHHVINIHAGDKIHLYMDKVWGINVSNYVCYSNV